MTLKEEIAEILGKVHNATEMTDTQAALFVHGRQIDLILSAVLSEASKCKDIEALIEQIEGVLDE